MPPTPFGTSIPSPENPFEQRRESQPLVTTSVEEVTPDPILGMSEFAVGPQIPTRTDTDSGEFIVDGLQYMPFDRAGELAFVWLVGLHGGAGLTTLTSLIPSASECRVWPGSPEPSAASRVILVARTTGQGLYRLQQAASQWATGTLEGIDLLGTVLVADGPKPDKALEAQIRQAKAQTPRTWHVRWQPEWRALREGDTYPVNFMLNRTLDSIIKTARKAHERTLHA